MTDHIKRNLVVRATWNPKQKLWTVRQSGRVVGYLPTLYVGLYTQFLTDPRGNPVVRGLFSTQPSDACTGKESVSVHHDSAAGRFYTETRAECATSVVRDTVGYANTALLHPDGSITAWWPRRWSSH